MSNLGQLADEFEEQRWIWPNRIPHQRVTMISGQGDAGKTRAILSIIKFFLKQEQYPDGSEPEVAPGPVLYLTTENKDYEMRDFLRRQGCEKEELDFLNIVNYIEEDGKDELFGFDLDLDKELIEKEIKAIKPVILVIDPLRSFHSHKDIDAKSINGLMMFLDKLAEKHKLTIICIIHWNKDSKMGRSERMAGSHQYRDAVRSVIIVERDQKEKGLRHFIQDKMNIGPDPIPLDFEFESPSGYLIWKQAYDTHPPTQVKLAETHLVNILTPGPLPAKDCYGCGVFPPATMYRARNRMRGSIVTFSKLDPETNITIDYWDIRCTRNDFGLLYEGGVKLG